MTRLLTFPDGYTLNFMPSGNTTRESTTRNPNGGYQLWDANSEIVLVMEVVGDNVRAHWFENGKNQFNLVDKVSDIHDYLGIDYTPSAGALTRWLVLTENDEKILNENFSGMIWSRIGVKRVLFRDSPLKMEKSFTEASIELLRLMIFAKCEEGFIQLLNNGSLIKTDVVWDRMPVTLRAVREGSVAMVKALIERGEIVSGNRDAVFVREALRNSDLNISQLAINLVPESEKMNLLNLVFTHCLQDRDARACSFIADQKVWFDFGNNRDQVIRTWREVIALRDFSLFEKVFNKTHKSILLIPVVKVLADEVGWWSAVKWLGEKERSL